MNNYQELLSKLTVSNIIDLWNEQHSLGKTIPADWLAAIEEHLADLEISPEQRNLIDKLFEEEKEIAIKSIPIKTKSSGNPDLGNRQHPVFDKKAYLRNLSSFAVNWLQASNFIRFFRHLAGSDSYLKYREKEQLKAVAGDRDQLLLKHILEKDGQLIEMGANHASSHIGVNGRLKYLQYDKPVALKDFNEGKERIVFAICPSWGVIFPPYGLAKMVGTLRKENYACKVYDLNIQTFHHLVQQTGIDYWRAEKQFYWQDPDFYNKYLAHHVNPILDMATDAILNDKPTLVGFSVYSTNLLSSLYMVRQLRKRQPDLVIVIGGPATATETTVIEAQFKKYVNYFFKGEAEECFLDCLQNGSFNQSKVPEGIFIGKFDSKIALNDKAFADYSDYDLSAYTHKDGGSIETSRGCVAQCSFCSETNFWKFRSMTPQRVIDEMKHQIENYGFKRFWFVDSLANGDLKNFKQLVDLMISNKLEIGWNSYSRCDGRMTKEFIEKMAESGCTGLSYGVESGSQKVLHDMRKKIEVWEIYNNLRDTFETKKIWTHVNWLIGFPTEENIDFYHSNVLIYNVRKYIHHISPGMGCGISELTDLNSRPQTYGIPWKERPWETTFLKNWYTEGYKNTLLNRFIRIKLFHIWLEILKSQTSSVIENAQMHDDINESYWFYTDMPNTEEEIEASEFIDFNRIKADANISFFNANTANDYFAYFYGFYQIFGSFELKVVFNPAQDLISWGSLASNYRAFVHFKVDNNGEYQCHIDHQFVHKGLTTETKRAYADEKKQLSEPMDFKSIFNLCGNISEWKTTQSMVKETIHESYRKASKKQFVVT